VVQSGKFNLHVLMDIQTVNVQDLKSWDRNPREAIDIERLKEVLQKRGQ